MRLMRLKLRLEVEGDVWDSDRRFVVEKRKVPMVK
jgi:hypothetical protein